MNNGPYNATIGSQTKNHSISFVPMLQNRSVIDHTINNVKFSSKLQSVSIFSIENAPLTAIDSTMQTQYNVNGHIFITR
jgi:hypothetical protein